MEETKFQLADLLQAWDYEIVMVSFVCVKANPPVTCTDPGQDRRVGKRAREWERRADLAAKLISVTWDLRKPHKPQRRRFTLKEACVRFALLRRGSRIGVTKAPAPGENRQVGRRAVTRALKSKGSASSSGA